MSLHQHRFHLVSIILNLGMLFFQHFPWAMLIFSPLNQHCSRKLWLFKKIWTLLIFPSNKHYFFGRKVKPDLSYTVIFSFQQIALFKVLLYHISFFCTKWCMIFPNPGIFHFCRMLWTLLQNVTKTLHSVYKGLTKHALAIQGQSLLIYAHKLWFRYFILSSRLYFNT